MRQKLGRKKVIHFRAMCTQVLYFFLIFSCDLEKNVIPVTIWEYRSYDFRFWAHPKMSKKRRFPECRWIQRRAKWGQNSGLGRRVIFSYGKIHVLALKRVSRTSQWSEDPRSPCLPRWTSSKWWRRAPARPYCRERCHSACVGFVGCGFGRR